VPGRRGDPLTRTLLQRTPTALPLPFARLRPGQLQQYRLQAFQLLLRERQLGQHLLVLILAHHQYLAIATDADARLRRLDLAAADALPGLDPVGHVRSAAFRARHAFHA